MVRYNYCIDIIEDNKVIDTITATSGKEAYKKLQGLYPDKMKITYGTFNIYIHRRKGPFFVIQTSEYIKKTPSQLGKEYRAKQAKKMKAMEEELQDLKSQL